MVIRQYTLKEAYIGNTRVTRYHNGKFSSYDIVSDYALSGYLRALENDGYDFCYDLAAEYERYLEVKEKYNEVVRDLNEARYHSIYGQKLINDEVVSYI